MAALCLWIAVQKAQAGDLKSLRRVNRTGEDYTRAQFGKGGVKAVKGDLDHAGLFDIGLPLGLSALTAEELADCFDVLCPCGKIHDPDALKKQRSRRLKAHQEARDWLAAERAKMPSREWFFAYGKNGLYAKGVPAQSAKPRRVYVGEIGQPAACYVSEEGNLAVLEGSTFESASVQEALLHRVSVWTGAQCAGFWNGVDLVGRTITEFER